MITISQLDQCAFGAETRLYMSFSIFRSISKFDEIYIMGNLNETCKYSDYNDYYTQYGNRTLKEGTFGECVKAAHEYLKRNKVLITNIILSVDYGKNGHYFEINKPKIINPDSLDEWILTNCNSMKEKI
jgi:hypothetical protein